MGRRGIGIAILSGGLLAVLLPIGWRTLASLGEGDDLPPSIATIKASYSSGLDVVQDMPKAIDLFLNPPMCDPLCPLAFRDRERPARVVILAKASHQAALVCSGVESEFPEILSQALKRAFRRNNEKIQ